MGRELKTMTALGAVLLLGLLGGCSTEAADEPEKNAQGETAAPAVERGESVGAKGSPCELPATFETAAGWTAEAVTAPGMPAQGPVTLACEIDAKPAGHIGFLRVWTGGKADDDPRKALEAFTAAEAPSREDAAFEETKVGPYDGVEVGYLNTGEMLDAPKKERALAFATPDGLVVLHLGGADTTEHEQMLPAFELTKRSVRAGS